MSDVYVELDQLLGEVRVRVLSVPCPKCGGLQDEPIVPDKIVKCKFCNNFYSVEASLNNESVEGLRNLVSNVLDDALGKYNKDLGAESEVLINLLQDYASQVLRETKSTYDSLGRLPTREELERVLKVGTQQILETMSSFSSELLDGQENLTMKMNSAVDGITSLRISMKEIKVLLEYIEQFYSADWKGVAQKNESFLEYHDMQDQVKKIIVRNVTIGRGEGLDSPLEIRFSENKCQQLKLIDPTVSRKHIQIKLCEDSFILLDLRSKNGTSINGKKIQADTAVKIYSGDEIQIGFNTKFKFTRYRKQDVGVMPF